MLWEKVGPVPGSWEEPPERGAGAAQGVRARWTGPSSSARAGAPREPRVEGQLREAEWVGG